MCEIRRQGRTTMTADHQDCVLDVPQFRITGLIGPGKMGANSLAATP